MLGRSYRTPDGREIRIELGLSPRGRDIWFVKIEGRAKELESRSLRQALALAADDRPNADWIVAIERGMRPLGA